MSLLQMSITAGLLIIVIVLIRAVALNRLPKTAFIILWGVTLFRLLVPVTIQTQFSFYSTLRGLVNFLTPSSAIHPLAESGVQIIPPVDGAAISPSFSVFDVANNIPAIGIIWFVGTLVFSITFAVIYINNYRILRSVTPIHDNDFLNEWLAKNRLMRPLSIEQSGKIATPLAVGLFKPRIILPKSIDMNDKRLLSHVLMHEYYHIKRFDTLWKMLLVCAVCVHWFNPLAWVMFVLASRDIEITCDEMVIRHFGEETKTAYACAIIGMAEQRSKFASLYNGFSKNAAEERIESVMKIKKSSIMGILVALVLVAALAIGTLSVFATDGQPRADGNSRHTVTFETPIYHNFQIMCAVTGETIATMSADEFVTWNEEMGIICTSPRKCSSPFCPGGCGEDNDFTINPDEFPFFYHIFSQTRTGLPYFPDGDNVHPDLMEAVLEAFNNR